MVAIAEGTARNLSTSSIGSTTSSIGTQEETRKRPPPLAMANESSTRARLSLDTYNNNNGGPNQQQYTYYNESPSGYSTPTSASFSTGAGSPRFPSAMASPVSTMSRSSFYNGARTSRRLSVPATNKPIPESKCKHVSASNVLQRTTNGQSWNDVAEHQRICEPQPVPSFLMVVASQRLNSNIAAGLGTLGTYSSLSQRPATSGLSYHQTPE